MNFFNIGSLYSISTAVSSIVSVVGFSYKRTIVAKMRQNAINFKFRPEVHLVHQIPFKCEREDFPTITENGLKFEPVSRLSNHGFSYFVFE
jgi:hypothetical protein